jgi:hypothetical protein
LITLDLIYPTFIFYLYYLFFKKLDKWEWTDKFYVFKQF